MLAINMKTNLIRRKQKIHFLILHGLSGLYKDQANNVYESHWKLKVRTKCTKMCTETYKCKNLCKILK